MSALSKIRNAGFELNLIDENIEIIPFSKLNQQQREFLRSHKAELIAELKATPPYSENLIVTCYTPNGKPVEVEARDQDHAAWLVKMNPKPPTRGAIENLKKPEIQQAKNNQQNTNG